MRAELGQPGRVGDVDLAARQVLDVPGVDQHHLEPGVLKVVERLPVVPGGLHHRAGDLLGDEMLTQGQRQGQDLVRGRAPRRDRLKSLAATSTGDWQRELISIMELYARISHLTRDYAVMPR